MKNRHALKPRITGRTLIAACATALVAAMIPAVPNAAPADRLGPPPIPANLHVPAGNVAFLLGHAVGTQNYICLPSGSAFAWSFFGPQATLFNRQGKQITTHYLGANPSEGGTLRATWQHSRDTSAVWGMAVASSSDPNFVAPGAIPWLLLQVVGAEDGPDGGDSLAAATFIHRLNTTGGIQPSTGCALSTDVGKRVFVPYTADYFFYKAARNRSADEN